MNSSKRELAINTHLWLAVILFSIFALVSISCIREGEIGLFIGFTVATLLPLFAFLTSPIYYVFSEESVEIIYLWGQKEQIKWSSVRSIVLFGSWLSDGGGLPHYHFSYPTNKKRVFFVCGDITKTWKTKKLIKKYYKKNII